MGLRKGNKCAFLPCGSYKNLSSTSFFSYPRNMERCHQWIINSGRLDLLEVFKDISNKDDTYFYRNYNLCSRHFEDDCFMNAQTRNRLVRGAIPTIFPVVTGRRGPGRPPGRKSKFKLHDHRPEHSKNSSSTITPSAPIKPIPSARGASKLSKDRREICYDAVEGLSTTITAADAASSSPVVINMPHNLVSPVIINVPGAKNSPLILSLSDDKVWTNVNPASGKVEDRKSSYSSSKARHLSLSEALNSVAAAGGTNSSVRSARLSEKTLIEAAVVSKMPKPVPIFMAKQVRQTEFVSNLNPSFKSTKESYYRSEAKKSRVKFAPGPVVLTINEPPSPGGSFTPVRPVAETIELATVKHETRGHKRSLSPDGLSWTDDEFDQSSDSSCSSTASYTKQRKVIHLSSSTKKASITSVAAGRSYRVKRFKEEPHSSDETDYSWTNVSRDRASAPTSSRSGSSAGANRPGVSANKVRGVKLVSMDKLLDLNVSRQSRIVKRAQQQGLELRQLQRLRIARDKEQRLDETVEGELRRTRLAEVGTERDPDVAGRQEVPNLAVLAARVAYETRADTTTEEERLSSGDHSCLYLTRQLRRFRSRTMGTTDRTPDRVSYPGPAHSAGEVIRLMDAPAPPTLTHLPAMVNTPTSRERVLEQISTKCVSLDHEIEVLSKERTLLASKLNIYRKDRHLVRKMIRKQLTDLRTAVRKYSSEYCALEYLKDRMPSSTFKFFKCQLFSCKCPQWDFDSMQIPVIAKRCGLGVRETLFKILRMPTLRTFTRYRNILLKNPSAVEDGHIVKNDLLINKYRRKIIRKRINFERNVSNLKSVSEILLDYVKKNNVELSTHEQ